MKSGSGSSSHCPLGHQSCRSLPTPASSDLQGKQKTAHTYICGYRAIPISFPYNQLSTCPTDNSSPLWVLFGPKPYRCPFTVARIPGQYSQRQKILRLALGLPCSYPHAFVMEPLLAFVALDHEFAVVLLTTQTVYLLWSAQQLPLTPGGDLSGMTRLHSVVVHHGYDCLQSDSFFSTHYSRSIPRGTHFFVHFPFVWAVSKIYTRSPSWNRLE